MATYLFSYDLNKTKDYQKLYDELANYNAKRLLESVWTFDRINTNAAGLQTYFKTFVDKDDRLLVAEVISITASNNG